MKLYLVPFRQEAKLLISILPNCRALPDSGFPGCCEYTGGRVVCWNQAGVQGVVDLVKKITDFSGYSEVILFGSAGSLAKELELGRIYTCTRIKDTFGGVWNMPAVSSFQESGLLTAEELVFENNKRQELWQKYNCELVDMEASAFAYLAEKNAFGDAKTGVVRFVSDTYEILPKLDIVTRNFTGKFPKEVSQQISKHRKNFL